MELQMLAAGQYAWTSKADPIRYYRLPLIGRLFCRRVARCVDLLPPGRSLLEIGYGSGVSFLNAAQRFQEIHGLDVHDRADEVAASFSGVGFRLHLRQGTITSMPYPDESFDSALAISVHEEIPLEQQDRAFAEVFRVLRPGGTYVVGVPGVNVLMNTALYALGCNIGRYHVTTERQVLERMRENFRLDHVQYTPNFLPKSLTTYVYIRGRKPS
jgi:ubiquinone/menaquinone biosynthesis C-methylase UbiE